MYECSPKPNRTPGLALGLILFVSAVILILPFHSEKLLSTLLLGIGFLFLIAACSVIERFVLTDYIYSVESSDGEMLFTVTAVRFRKNMTVCRVSVSQMSELVLTSKHLYKTKAKRYNYCPDLIPKSQCFLRLTDDREVIVRFSPDRTMINILNSLITENK